MRTDKIFTQFKLGSTILSNRIVMAPMTRCRANGNIPNALMAEYYKQRAGAGLIITEGTSPSPNGLGYARMPGIFSRLQIEGWKLVTDAVHKAKGKIFVQIMHSGRISHQLNMPERSHIIAPSAVKPEGQMWTDSDQMQDFPIPKAMTESDILATKKEFTDAAKNAMEAGFDGVELHAANGYLLEQFISPVSNIRSDIYGGSIENRCRFVLDVINEVSDAIGKGKTGIRLSPHGVASDMKPYPETDITYKYLVEKLTLADIAYIHLVDHSSMGAPIVSPELKKLIRNTFQNALILSGGYNLEKANEDLENELCDLVAFGRPFINNPDLVERLKSNWNLTEELLVDQFYTADEKGYTDYALF